MILNRKFLPSMTDAANSYFLLLDLSRAFSNFE